MVFSNKKFENGYQVEYPGQMVKRHPRLGNQKRRRSVDIPFYGHIEIAVDEKGKLHVHP